jgi:hypothetical protein
LGDPEFFVSLFGLVLTFGQSALLEELPGIVIRSLSAAGAGVLERDKQKKNERPRSGGNPEPIIAPDVAKCPPNACQCRLNNRSPADIQRDTPF